MNTWHPIETAPKDGRHFLAWYPEGMWGPDESYEKVGLAMVASWELDWNDQRELKAVGYEGGLPFGEPTLWTPFNPPSL